ncbi:MAG: hypothetical protein ACU4EQ_10900 [Candidatus Nitrosoglobus sp.]
MSTPPMNYGEYPFYIYKPGILTCGGGHTFPRSSPYLPHHINTGGELAWILHQNWGNGDMSGLSLVSIYRFA